MRRPRNLGLLIAVAALLLVGCGQQGSRRGARVGASPNPVPTAAAKTTTVRASTTISGVIAPLQNVAITSSLAEAADAVNVNEGDRVRAGQVIAVLDTADLQAQLAQAVATVATDERIAASDDAKVVQAQYTQKLNIGQSSDQVRSARAVVVSAQSTLSNDQLTLSRDAQLLSSGYIAQSQYDQQKTQVQNDTSALHTAQANLESAITNQQVNGTTNTGLQAANVASVAADARAARATIQQAQAQVQQFQASIAKATIVSPVNGVVVNRNLNPGEYPGARTIFTIQELDHVYAELNASSADTFAIPVGAPVTVIVSAGGSRTYNGKVVAVLGQVTPGSTNFTVKVLVQNADGKLQSGLPVTATAGLPPVSGIGIPTTAFLDDTHTSVMIVDDEVVDTVAKLAHVRELGSDGKTSIVSGLKKGQLVISNGQLGVTDGQSLSQD
jgi:multidrug efflux pump subunit AcrA (membrane-fusion protein)